MLLLWACLAVARLTGPRGSGGAVSDVLDWLRACLLGGLLWGLVLVVVALLGLRMSAWGAPTTAPRPRGQYLLAAWGRVRALLWWK